MKRLKTKWFTKWAKKNKISSDVLINAINNVIDGLSCADLGANLYKVRIARKGGGKSKGFRTLLVYKNDDKAIFLYGFAKNEQDNISKTELEMLKKLGNDLLILKNRDIEKAINSGILYLLEG